MNGEELLAWQGVIVFLIALPVLATVVTLLGRQYRRVAEAKAALARDEAYRELAAAAVAAHQQNATELAKLATDLDDVKRSMAAVERLLRAVG
jgi:hypothetical protein